MARPENLQPGELNAAARPVDVFLRPIEQQLAKPAAPAGMTNPQGVQTVSTGGTTYVQGSNNYALLAEALVPFTKNAVNVAEVAGLAFADWRMDQGEAAAYEAQQRALVKVDESTEVAQLERAAATRKVAAKDPQAGFLMNFLDPYKQIGYERGLVKLAAQEITMGLPGYVQQRGGEINYLGEDQGFGALQKIRADYTRQITQKYGIDSGSPGFQKYFLPAATKAGESVANAIAQDRVKFLDEQVPKQAAAQMQMIIGNANTSGQVEYNGYVYTKKNDPNLFATALKLRLAQVMQQSALTSGLPGGATKRYEEVYKILQSDTNFYGDQAARYLIDGIPTNTPLIGGDGKAVIDPQTGKPKTYTLGQLYSQESLDSRLRYGRAGAAERTRELTEGIDGFRDLLARKLNGVPPGPQQAAIANETIRAYYGSEQNRQISRVGLDELQKIAADVVGNSNKFLYIGSNEAAIPDFYQWLQGAKGGNFNESEARDRQRATANQILDPSQKAQFLLRSNDEISQAAKQQGTTASQRGPRDKAINRQIEVDVAQEYPVVHTGNRQDVDAGKALAYRRYLVVSDAAIQDWKAKYGTDPSDAQVEQIVKGAIYQLRKAENDDNALDRSLYPGGKSGGPSRRPQPLPVQPNTKAPTPKVYDINQLDDIPNRQVLLRQYTGVPVLSLPAIVDILDLAEDGKKLPTKFERAWRDAGAQSGYDFIKQQLQFYPNYRDPRSNQQLLKIRQRLSSAASTVNSMVAARVLADQYPALAGIASWHQQLTFGG